MKPSVSIIFEQKPEQWGLRGDPYLSDDLQTAFAKIPLPCSKSQFIQLLEKYFQELTNYQISKETSVFVWRVTHMEECRVEVLVCILFSYEKSPFTLSNLLIKSGRCLSLVVFYK